MKKPDNYFGFAFDDNMSPKTKRKLFRQLKRDGIDESETWSLYWSLANYILPRLKIFRKTAMSYPLDLESHEWDAVLDKMIYSFETIVADDRVNRDDARIDEGIDLFCKYFRNLWS